MLSNYYSTCVNLSRLRKILAEKGIEEPADLERRTEIQMKVFVHGLKFIASTTAKTYTTKGMSGSLKSITRNPIDFGGFLVSHDDRGVRGWTREFFDAKKNVRSPKDVERQTWLLQLMQDVRRFMAAGDGLPVRLEDVWAAVPRTVRRQRFGAYAFVNFRIKDELRIVPAEEQPRLRTRDLVKNLVLMPRHGEARAAQLGHGLLLWTDRLFIWTSPGKITGGKHERTRKPGKSVQAPVRKGAKRNAPHH